MEGVLLPGFGDVGLERPRDVGSEEIIASAESSICAELSLDTRERGVLPQAGCNLSAVLDRKQAEVAVALLEHKVVCLPYLLGGGMEGEPGIGEPWIGECGVYAVFLAVFLRLCVFDVGGNGGTPGRSEGRHDERSFSV